MQLGALQYTWVIGLVLLAVFFLWRAQRMRSHKLALFAEHSLYPTIYPVAAEDKRWSIVSAILTICALTLLACATLRPQWGFTWTESKKTGVDIVVAVDVSESMLTRDINPSRLERARRELLDLLDRLRGDRIALVAFAGIAFIEMPLTLDYSTFRLFLNSLDPDLIPVKGTNVQLALEKAIEAFGIQDSTAASTNSNRGRAILLLTDGEDFDGDWSAIKESVKAHGIRVFVIGIGTTEGAPIPGLRAYRKDRDGNLIVSRLQKQALEQLAVDTGGQFAMAIASDDDVVSLYDLGIKRTLEDSELEGGRSKQWNEYYQIPLLLSLLCFLAIWIVDTIRTFRTPLPVPASKQQTAANISSRTKHVAAAAISILLVFFPYRALAESTEELGLRAKRSFEKANFAEAGKVFSEAKTQQADDYRFSMGEGAVYYRNNEFEKAKQSFSEATEKAPNDSVRAKALYNSANAMVQLGEYQPAVEAYKQALELAPSDSEAHTNLEYAKKLLEQQQQDQQQQSNNQQNQEQQDQQQQNQQNQQSEEEQSQQEQQSQQDQQEGDQSKNQEQTQEQQQEQEQQKSSENTDKQQGDKTDSQQQAGQLGEDEQKTQHDTMLESLLSGVTEDRESLLKYRTMKAMREMKEKDIVPPTKDW